MSRSHIRLILFAIIAVVALVSSFFKEKAPSRPTAPTDPIEVSIEPYTIENPYVNDSQPKTAPTASTNETADLAQLNQGILHGKEEVAIVEHLVAHGTLPDSFITKRDAKMLGWNASQGNLHDVAPGKSIGGDRFSNRERALPDAGGRMYFEADLNYDGGHRGAERLVYSDDGLIYVTRDHYRTFQQVKTKP